MSILTTRSVATYHAAVHAQGLAQLITDNPSCPQYISHEQRAAEWQRERAQEAAAVAACACSLCGGHLEVLDAEYLRCSCGHLARVTQPRKVRKAYSRDSPRFYCPGCGQRRMRRMCVNGLCKECRV